MQGSWADLEMPSATAAPSSTCSQSLPLEGPALLPEGMELETQEGQGRRERMGTFSRAQRGLQKLPAPEPG